MDVALISCVELPEPDPDERLLLHALGRRGLTARVVAWDDPSTDPSEAAVAVIRSSWNYHLRRDDFLAWCEGVAGRTTLLNPPSVVRWSSHKSYLGELESRGFPVVPTRFVFAGADVALEDLVPAGWEEVVVKPTVSAGSFGTIRVPRERLVDGEEHFRRLVAERDVMVQQYLPSVEGYGERALVWIDGELTHCVRKSPRFSGDDESVSEALSIAEDEERLAQAVVAWLPRGLLYARIDVARDASGRPCIMELELVEPSLFLLQHERALDLFADAIARRVP